MFNHIKWEFVLQNEWEIVLIKYGICNSYYLNITQALLASSYEAFTMLWWQQMVIHALQVNCSACNAWELNTI